jgi:glycosyltransferase involved in cell wall biosynthesis
MFTPVVRYLPVFYLPMIGRNASHGTYRWSLRRVADRFRGKVDAVYSSWLYPDGVVGTKLASELGVPSWIMVLGSDTFHLENSLRRREILRACNSASGVICVAPHLKRRLVDAGAEEAKIHVVPNGVDAELFHYRPKEDAWADLRGQEMDCSTKPLEEKLEENSREKVQPLGSKENNFQFSIFNFQFPTPLILFVGNLVPVKGPDVLLEAFARLAGGQSPELSDPESRIIALCTIGDGPMRGDLARQARRLGIADRVLFLGNRPHEEVALWMNAADCLCLASRDEGMPNVVLEALACGLPVAATDVGGCREMLAGEPACRLARSEDPVDLAGAILGVLNAAVNRADLAARHGERSWNTMAREILARLTIEK